MNAMATGESKQGPLPERVAIEMRLLEDELNRFKEFVEAIREGDRPTKEVEERAEPQPMSLRDIWQSIPAFLEYIRADLEAIKHELRDMLY